MIGVQVIQVLRLQMEQALTLLQVTVLTGAQQLRTPL
jgi:hypothetical protein